ncbi:unnamed protein product [marine sediment metagenome]|uniref:Uncharacterized protein n=1 Tax=marine sediment metagenome TaxID=412755 RepID=X1A699_9ZZZZ
MRTGSNFRSGAYAGGELAFASTSGHVREPFGSAGLGSEGVAGGVFAGYALHVGAFQIAAQVLAQISTIGSSAIATAAGTYNQVGINNMVALSILPGVIIGHNALAFIQLGVASAHFSATLPGITHISTHLTGILFGMGLQAHVAGCISVRGEFVHGSFASVTRTVAGVRQTFSPQSNQFGAQLLCQFSA